MKLGNVRNQRGAGMIGCAVMLVLALGGIYAAVMLGGPKFKNSAFSDRLNETMPMFVRQPENEVRKQIVTMAQEFDIDLKPENVKIETVRKRLNVYLSYDKFVDLQVWQTTLHFDLHREGPPPE